jgi:Tfp pilus assembly protein PilF
MRLALFFLYATTLAAQGQASRPNTNQLLAEADHAQAANDLKTAERDYAQLVQLHPKSAELHAAYGAVLALDTRYREAVGEFEAALAGTPRKRQPELLYAIGKSYTSAEDCKDARPPLEQALAIQPANIPAVVLLGECDLTLKQPEAAVALMAPRATLSTRDIPFLKVYGRALIESGKLGEGAEMLAHVAQSTGDPETYKLAGSTFLKNDDIPSARRNLEMARRLDPGIDGVDVLLATARERAGDSYAAEAIFRDRLKTTPDDFTANLYLGTLLYRHRKAPEAAAYLGRALALRPGDETAQCEAAALRNHGECPMIALQ